MDPFWSTFVLIIVIVVSIVIVCRCCRQARDRARRKAEEEAAARAASQRADLGNQPVGTYASSITAFNQNQLHGSHYPFMQSTREYDENPPVQDVEDYNDLVERAEDEEDERMEKVASYIREHGQPPPTFHPLMQPSESMLVVMMLEQGVRRADAERLARDAAKQHIQQYEQFCRTQAQYQQQQQQQPQPALQQPQQRYLSPYQANLQAYASPPAISQGSNTSAQSRPHTRPAPPIPTTGSQSQTRTDVPPPPPYEP